MTGATMKTILASGLAVAAGMALLLAPPPAFAAATGFQGECGYLVSKYSGGQVYSQEFVAYESLDLPCDGGTTWSAPVALCVADLNTVYNYGQSAEANFWLSYWNACPSQVGNMPVSSVLQDYEKSNVTVSPTCRRAFTYVDPATGKVPPNAPKWTMPYNGYGYYTYNQNFEGSQCSLAAPDEPLLGVGDDVGTIGVEAPISVMPSTWSFNGPNYPTQPPSGNTSRCNNKLGGCLIKGGLIDSVLVVGGILVK